MELEAMFHPWFPRSSVRPKSAQTALRARNVSRQQMCHYLIHTLALVCYSRSCLSYSHPVFTEHVESLALLFVHVLHIRFSRSTGGCRVLHDVVFEAICNGASTRKDVTYRRIMALHFITDILYMRFDMKYNSTWHCICSKVYGSLYSKILL